MKVNNVSVLAVSMFLFYLIIGVVYLFAPIYLVKAGFSNLEVGFAIGVTSIVALLTSFAFGVLNDRASPVKISIIGLLLCLPLLAFLPAAGDFAMLFVLFLVYDVGVNLFEITTNCLMYKSLDGKRKGFGIGGFKFSASLGCSVGYAAGGFLIIAIGFYNIFLALALLTVLLIPVLMMLRSPPIRLFDLSCYKRDYLKKDVLFFSLVMFLIAFHFGAEQTSMPLYASFTLGLPESLVGVMFFASQMTYGLFSFGAGFLSDRMKNFKKLFIAGLFLSAMGNILYGFAPDFATAALTRVMHEIGDGLALTFSAYMITVFFSKQRVGGNFGLYSTILLVATFVGSVVSGALNDVIGYGGAMVFAGSLTLAGLALMLLSKNVSRRIMAS